VVLILAFILTSTGAVIQRLNGVQFWTVGLFAGLGTLISWGAEFDFWRQARNARSRTRVWWFRLVLRLLGLTGIITQLILGATLPQEYAELANFTLVPALSVIGLVDKRVK
jgi:uncharacterized membrane protein